MKTIFQSFLAVLLLLLSPEMVAQDFNSLQYRSVGPARGGRVTAVAGTPAAISTYYMGATGGGVWKTTDYGSTWNNVSDGFFDSPSIGAISVAENDPNLIYVGTGSDGIRSNVIAGKGMYKSIDAGATWQHIGLKETAHIGAVEIDPGNSNIVWVAAIGNVFRPNAERGLFKTENGGNTWEKSLFISDQVGIVDVELVPNNPNVIYAAAWKVDRKPWTIISGGTAEEGGIYKSEDAGKSWIKLNEGLPQGTIGKIDLAVTKANSSILYAIIEAPGEEGGLYRSENQGKSFTQISSDKRLVNRPFYYCNVAADPKNEDIVYSLANPMLKSEDGGTKWTEIEPPHGDNHDMWINPENPDLYVQGNDGGANVTHNGGKTWSTQYNQPTAELYQVEVDDQYPYWLYAGQQDNYSTIAVPSYAPNALQDTGVGWIINTGGCETGPAVPKPGDHNTVYANCKGVFGVFNKLTGTQQTFPVGASNIYGHNPKNLKYRFQRVAPVHVSPHDPNVVYHGSQYLHKTINGGQIWETISPDLTAFEADKQVISGTPITRDITGEEYYSTLYSIRESPVQEGVIWTGSNDGVIQLTKDGGTTWKNVTPKQLPKGGRVDAIVASSYDKAKAYIAVLRHQLGDDRPYIYRTSDYGASWELLTTGENGIPNDFPTRVVREDPVREGLLFAGTEFGVFVSFNDGKQWQAFQQNLPVTPITDIKIHRGDLVLSTMGRSFWILDNITSLRQKEINNLNDTPVLFKPDTSIRYRYPKIRNEQGTFPLFPQPSVTIDYYLPETSDTHIRMDILDANKKLVATIVNDSSEQKMTTTLLDNMNTNQIIYLVDQNLINKKGLNRFEWDMRHTGPWDKNTKRRYKNGPLAAPGIYTVKLTAAGVVKETSFELKIDPRVEEIGVTSQDLAKQVAMQQQISDLLSAAKKLQNDLEKKEKALKDKNADAAQLDKVTSALGLLKSDEGAYPLPKLTNQIGYLYNVINDADQLPGAEVEKRITELKAEFVAAQNAAALVD